MTHFFHDNITFTQRQISITSAEISGQSLLWKLRKTVEKLMITLLFYFYFLCVDWWLCLVVVVAVFPW